MTPCRLEDKQLANPHVRIGYDVLVERREFAALYIWNCTIRLAAASTEVGTLRADSRPAAMIGLTGLVARQGRISEPEAETALKVLHDFGLVTCSEDAITLPVTVRRPGLPGEVRDRGGRPRGHETKEEARERRLAEQERKAAAARAQGTMLHAIPGGKVAAAAAETSAETSPETSPENLTSEFKFPGGVSEEVFGQKTAETGFEVSSREFSTPAAAAAAVEVRESIPYQQQQQQRVPESRASETGNFATEVSGEVSAEVSGEVSAEVSEVSGEVSAAAVSPEAAAIAADLVRDLDLRGNAAAQAGCIVQGWLTKGYQVEDVREGTRSALTRRGEIGSLKWFTNKVHDAAKARLARERPSATPPGAAGGSASQPKPLHRAIAETPAWAGQPLPVRAALNGLLDAWDLPERHQRREGRLKLHRGFSEAAWRLFAAVHPEAWEAIGLDPPRAAAG